MSKASMDLHPLQSEMRQQGSRLEPLELDLGTTTGHDVTPFANPAMRGIHPLGARGSAGSGAFPSAEARFLGQDSR
jgi:hypothetical protein